MPLAGNCRYLLLLYQSTLSHPQFFAIGRYKIRYLLIGMKLVVKIDWYCIIANRLIAYDHPRNK